MYSCYSYLQYCVLYRGVFAVSVEPAADEDGPLDGHGGDQHVQGHRGQAVPSTVHVENGSYCTVYSSGSVPAIE